MKEAGNIALPIAFNILDKWGSSQEDQVLLLGFDDLVDLIHAKQNPEGVLLSNDTLERMSYIFSIYSSLVLLYGQKNLGLNWLKKPQEIFGNEAPLKHAETKNGGRDVKELLGRISHGVFS